MMATVAEIIGADLPSVAAEDSQSLVDVLKHSDSAFKRLPILVTNNRNGNFAITEGRWKLIMPTGNTGRALYDLTADIAEKDNQISQYPEVAQQLEVKLTQMVCRGRSTDGPRLSNDTGWWPGITWMNAAEYKAKHPEGKPVVEPVVMKADKGSKKGKK